MHAPSDKATRRLSDPVPVQDVLEKDRRRTMLMSMRSRTITASRRASCGLAGSTSIGSGPSRRASLAGLSPRGSAGGEAAADAPFPEFEADVELQMPPLAVSPSGEICVQERSMSPHHHIHAPPHGIMLGPPTSCLFPHHCLPSRRCIPGQSANIRLHYYADGLAWNCCTPSIQFNASSGSPALCPTPPPFSPHP